MDISNHQMEHQRRTVDEFKINLFTMHTDQPPSRDHEPSVPVKKRKKVVSHTTNTPVVREIGSHLPSVHTRGPKTRVSQATHEKRSAIRNYDSLQSSELLSPNNNPLNQTGQSFVNELEPKYSHQQVVGESKGPVVIQAEVVLREKLRVDDQKAELVDEAQSSGGVVIGRNAQSRTVDVPTVKRRLQKQAGGQSLQPQTSRNNKNAQFMTVNQPHSNRYGNIQHQVQETLLDQRMLKAKRVPRHDQLDYQSKKIINSEIMRYKAHAVIGDKVCPNGKQSVENLITTFGQQKAPRYDGSDNIRKLYQSFDYSDLQRSTAKPYLHVDIQNKQKEVHQSQVRLNTLSQSVQLNSHRQFGGGMLASPAVMCGVENGPVSIRDRVYQSDIFDIKEVLAKALQHDFKRKLRPLETIGQSPLSQSHDFRKTDNRYKVRSRLFKQSPSRKLLAPMPQEKIASLQSLKNSSSKQDLKRALHEMQVQQHVKIANSKNWAPTELLSRSQLYSNLTLGTVNEADRRNAETIQSSILHQELLKAQSTIQQGESLPLRKALDLQNIQQYPRQQSYLSGHDNGIDAQSFEQLSPLNITNNSLNGHLFDFQNALNANNLRLGGGLNLNNDSQLRQNQVSQATLHLGNQITQNSFFQLLQSTDDRSLKKGEQSAIDANKTIEEEKASSRNQGSDLEKRKSALKSQTLRNIHSKSPDLSALGQLNKLAVLKHSSRDTLKSSLSLVNTEIKEDLHEEEKSPVGIKNKNRSNFSKPQKESPPKSSVDPHEFKDGHGIETKACSPVGERQESKQSFIGTPESPIKMEKLQSNYEIVNIYRVDNDQKTESSKRPLNETHGTLKQLQQATSSTFSNFNRSKKSKSYRQTPNKDLLIMTGSYDERQPQRIGMVSLKQKSKKELKLVEAQDGPIRRQNDLKPIRINSSILQEVQQKGNSKRITKPVKLNKHSQKILNVEGIQAVQKPQIPDPAKKRNRILTRDTEPLNQVDFGFETNATLARPAFDPNNSISLFNGTEITYLNEPNPLLYSTGNNSSDVSPLPNVFNLAEALQDRQQDLQMMMDLQDFEQLQLQEPIYPNCDLQTLIKEHSGLSTVQPRSDLNQSPQIMSTHHFTTQPSYVSLAKSPSQIIDKTNLLDTSNTGSKKKLNGKIDWKEKLIF